MERLGYSAIDLLVDPALFSLGFCLSFRLGLSLGFFFRLLSERLLDSAVYLVLAEGWLIVDGREVGGGECLCETVDEGVEILDVCESGEELAHISVRRACHCVVESVLDAELSVFVRYLLVGSAFGVSLHLTVAHVDQLFRESVTGKAP